MSTLTLTESNDGQSFNLQTGDQILVEFDESPTTGYRWAVDYVGDVLAFQNSNFSPAGSGIGGGGKRVFSFTAERAGSSRLSMKLWRDWEGDSSVIKRFDASLHIN
jgi:inhibitor of cysteine peptidase